MGYDTWYENDADDLQLIELCHSEQRVLLTRDTRMLNRRELPEYLFIKHNDLHSQIAQVIATYSLEVSPQQFFSRCPDCNAPLEKVGREAVAHLVPVYVAKHATTFTMCPESDKIFWSGTHYQKAWADCLQMLRTTQTYFRETERE